MWQPDLTGRPRPRYRAIADALAEAVSDGTLPPGTRLPTHRALAERLGVTVGTVTRAYTEAERRGLVDATVGSGTFVRDGGGDSLAAGPMRVDESARAKPSTAGAADAVADLSTNAPAPGPVTETLAAIATELSGRADWQRVGAYQAAAGHPDHRAALAAWLSRTRMPASAGEIVPVAGVQTGQALALQLLCDPGDSVLLGDLTWPGMRDACQMQRLRPVGVAMDAEGIRPDALDEAARRTGARVVFTMPTLHNPTTTTMGEARRRDVLASARAHGLTVLEDDIYGFLAPDSAPPLAALDRERVVYLNSLSKAVAPGLRAGVAIPPPSLRARFAAAVRAGMLMTPPLDLEWAKIAVESGLAERAATAQRTAAGTRQRRLAERLDGHALHTDPRAFHAWLTLPEGWSTSAFTRAAEARGVVVTPGDAFAHGADPRAVRLCLCAPESEATLTRALDTLAALLATPPESVGPVV